MIMGLYNPDHCTKIMQEVAKHPTFDEKYKMLAALHSTDISTAELETSGSTTGKSAYKNTKKCTDCKGLVDSNNAKHTKCSKCFRKPKKDKKCKCGGKLSKPQFRQCDACFKERRKKKDNAYCKW